MAIVTKLTDVYDVRDWTRDFGNGANDDGQTITDVAAMLKNRGGGRMFVPIPFNLDTTAVIPPGVHVDGHGSERSRGLVRNAPVGFDLQGANTADLQLGGGLDSLGVELTTAGQGGIKVTGSRRRVLRNLAVLGNLSLIHI